MANRVCIQADLDAYAANFAGSGFTMQIGDIIINTATSTAGDGKQRIFYTNGATAFAGARQGATIWIDGAALPLIYDFRLNNGDTGPSSIWNISSEAAPVHVRPIPGTQVHLERNALTNSGYTFLMHDIKFLTIDGENNAYPGMREWSPSRVFLRGSFGFWISGGDQLLGGDSGHMISISVPNGGHLTLRGIETEHGFAAIRYQGIARDEIADFTCERCYLHDGCTGEGFYLGATAPPPLCKLRNMNIRDVIVARRAAESIQLQHLIASSQKASVRNFVVYASSMDYLDAFQPSQDGCFQWSCDQGNNYIEDFIVDGWASTGVTCYGSDQAVADPNIPACMQRGYFQEGRSTLMFIHNSTVHGMKWQWKDLFIRRMNNTYYEGGETPVLHLISNNNGTDKHQFMNILTDTSKDKLFQSLSNFEIINSKRDASFTGTQYDPVYVRSGFYESVEKLQTWASNYALYLSPTEAAIPFTAGDIVVNIVENVEYAFYKCILTHTSTPSTRPDLDPTHWTKLTWDSTGLRSDQPGWNSGLTQSKYPPDDFRLVADNYWNLKGYGLLANEQNTVYSQYQWYRSNNADGSGAVAIPGAKSLKYTPQEVDRNRYLALAVRVKGSNGIFDTQRYSAWRQVT